MDKEPGKIPAISVLRPTGETASRSLRRHTWLLIGLGAVVCLSCVGFLEAQWQNILALEQRANEYHQRSALLTSTAIRELEHLSRAVLIRSDVSPDVSPDASPDVSPDVSLDLATGTLADRMDRLTEALAQLRAAQNRFLEAPMEQALSLAEADHARLRDQLGQPRVDPRQLGETLHALHHHLIDLEHLHTSDMAVDRARMLHAQNFRPWAMLLFLVVVPGAGLVVVWRILQLTSQAVRRQSESEAAVYEAQRIAGLGQWDWDMQNGLLSWSEQTFHIFGLPPTTDPMPDSVFSERLFPADEERVEAAADAALHGPGPYVVEHRVLRPDGQVRWVHERGEVLRHPETGAPLRMLGTVLDVTALKESQLRLAESQSLLLAINTAQAEFIHNVQAERPFERLLENILHLTGSGCGFIAEVDHAVNGDPLLRPRATRHIPHGTLQTDTAPAGAACRGIDIGDGEELPLGDMHPLLQATVQGGQPVIFSQPQEAARSATGPAGLPAGHPPLVTFLGLPLHAGERLVGMIGLANRDGGYSTDIARSLEPLLNTCGGLIRAMRDSRGRAAAERALMDSERRFREMAENIREAFWVSSPDGTRLLYVSPAYEELFAQPVAAVYHDSGAFLAHVHADDRPRVAKALASVRERQHETFRVVHPHGGVRWAEARGFPVRDASGHICRVVGIAMDITARKEAEEAERRHREELARVLRLTTMGEVASGIAHELNQPLFAITNYARGSARLLAAGASTPELAEILEKIARQAERASDVIDHLRALARGDGIELRPHSLNDLVRGAVRLAVGDERDGLPRVHLQLAEHLPRVAVDRIQVEQVIINLVRNALEAVGDDPHAEILVRTALHGRDSASGGLSANLSGNPSGNPSENLPGGVPGGARVTIHDSGPGIPPKYLGGEIFEPFFTTKSGGMGMGLAISRTIIQAHQGAIWAANGERGAVFGFALPEYQAATQQPFGRKEDASAA